MSNYLSGVTSLHAAVGSIAGTTVSLEGRMPKAEPAEPEDVAGLRVELSRRWQANPGLSSAEIIDCVRNFSDSKGGTPYTNIPEQSIALAGVLEKLKSDGQKDTPLYTAVNKGLCLAIMNNMFLNDFIFEMMKPPEDLDL